MHNLFAYTDGACSGNPGPGGWGVLLVAKTHQKIIKERELCGGQDSTTNNQMELLAAISALEILDRPSKIKIITDSSYVKNGVTQWLENWKKNKWKTAARKPVKNAELWRRLDEAKSRHEVTWEWVKGHAGHPENERADELARKGMEPFKSTV
jgi:ribonuclease HI